MREDDAGRDKMPLWSIAPVAPTYAVGERVFGAIDGVAGTVADVSTVIAPLVSVVWSDGGKEAVIYPMDTVLIRKAWPWE